MPYVKLDCSILNSSLWHALPDRHIFITALLMAKPYYTTKPMPQIKVSNLDSAGWEVPPGEYGLVEAAGPALLRFAGLDTEADRAAGLEALVRLGSPDEYSKSDAYDGRRLVRVDGGYIVLNYMKFREKDYTNAERCRRYREKLATRRVGVTTRRVNMQAEAEASKNTSPTPSPLLLEVEPVGKAKRGDRDGELAEKLYQAYPRHEARLAAIPAIKRALKVKPYDQLMAATTAYAQAVARWPAGNESFVCLPATWFNQGRYDDDPKGWERIAPTNGASRAGIQAALDRLIEETRFLPTGPERDGKLKEIEAMKGRLAQIP